MDDERAETQTPGRDEANWAKPVEELRLSGDLPPGAINLNVEGKRLAGMAGGFGKLWQKTYKISLAGSTATPQDVVRLWKDHFPEFWPKGANFYGSLTGIAPGETALLNLKVGGPAKLSTGIFVLYADDVSFSFINPEGHMFAGMITFSAHEENGATVAQVQALIRASDPFYELNMPLVLHRKEDKFWAQTLQNLAARFGVQATSEMTRVCVDRKRQWSQWKNIRKNAGIRSMAYSVTKPFRRSKKRARA